jgi:hypothetical protein
MDTSEDELTGANVNESTSIAAPQETEAEIKKRMWANPKMPVTFEVSYNDKGPCCYLTTYLGDCTVDSVMADISQVIKVPVASFGLRWVESHNVLITSQQHGSRQIRDIIGDILTAHREITAKLSLATATDGRLSISHLKAFRLKACRQLPTGDFDDGITLEFKMNTSLPFPEAYLNPDHEDHKKYDDDDIILDQSREEKEAAIVRECIAALPESKIPEDLKALFKLSKK